MSTDLLRRREDQNTEFKAADALREPSGIAREVVGMLNAGGGVIYIGVDDEGGEAVAINPVTNPTREADRLLDFLVDTLDPSPTAQEIVIEKLSSGTDRAVLAVHVSPKEERKPYSFRKSGGLHFLRRVGARNQPMSRLEIGQAFRESSPQLESVGRAEVQAREKLTTALQRVRDSVGEGLWVGMQPVRKLDLDPEDPRLEALATDPSLSGNRRSGWHFARSNSVPRPGKDQFAWGLGWETRSKYVSRVVIARDGSSEFWASLQRLHWKGEERELWPLALLEYPISAFRIAREIYREQLGPNEKVLVQQALLGAAGWGLRGGTPGDSFLIEPLVPLKEADDLVFEPDVVEFHGIDRAPDLCGFRLVRRIYHSFGLREAEIPQQFDRKGGKLVLPD